MPLEVCTASPCALAGADALYDVARRACAEADADPPIASPCLGRCEVAPVVRADDAPLAHATADAVRALIAGTLTPDPEGARTPRAWRVMDALVDGPDFEPEDALAAFAEADLRLPGGQPLADAIRALAAAASPRLVVARVRPGRGGSIAARVLAEELPELLVEGLALCALCGDADGALAWLSPTWPVARQALDRTITRYGEAFPVPVELTDIAALPTPRVAGPPPLLVLDPGALIAAATIFRRGAAWWRERGGITFTAITGHVVHPGVVELDGTATVGDALAAAGGADGDPGTLVLGDAPRALGPEALALTLADAAARAGATHATSIVVARVGTDPAILARMTEPA